MSLILHLHSFNLEREFYWNDDMTLGEIHDRIDTNLEHVNDIIVIEEIFNHIICHYF